MWPWDVVLLDMPSSHSHSHFTSAWLLLPLSTCHLTYPFGLVCFFPSPPAIHLPIPHHQVWQCFTHIKHLRHQHSTLAWFASSPLHPPLPIPHHQVWQCFAHIKHLRHQHITSAWFASSPLHPPFTYPFHTTRSGSASLTSST